MKPVSQPSSARLLEEAYGCHRVGALGEARVLYERLLEREPGHGQALHLLGVVCHQQGEHALAVELLERASRAEGCDTYVLNNLGEAYRALGRLDEAMGCYRRSLELDEVHAAAHSNLGLVLLRRGEFAEAVRSYRRALSLAPGDAEVHANLGNGLALEGMYEEAVGCYRRALELAPGLRGVWRCLGNALFEQSKLEEASEAYAGALAEDPGDVDVLVNYAKTLQRRGCYEEAVVRYREAQGRLPQDLGVRHDLAACLIDQGALADAERLCRETLSVWPDNADALLDLAETLYEHGALSEAEQTARRVLSVEPGHASAWSELGYILFHQGRLEEASESFCTPMRRLRGLEGSRGSGAETFCKLTRTKLRSDLEQLEYLLGRGKLPGSYEALAGQYREQLERVPRLSADGQFVFEVPALEPFADYYNRLWYEQPERLLAGGALNPALDWEAIEARYRQGGVAYFDGLLSAEALRGLQRFCTEPTIWFGRPFVDEVGTTLGDGFCCPLLLQIAWELREALPEVFGKHLFRTCWAYKYYQRGVDGHTHADHGSVSINLWVTPDECNLEPDTGGLVLWNKRVPKAYFQTPADGAKHAVQEALVNESDAQTRYVPYACNRAMVFDSNVLHKSHRQCFDDDYPARRISVTFLYGKPD